MTVTGITGLVKVGLLSAAAILCIKKDFLQAVLKECRNAYIHTAIETSGFFPQETYLATMKYVDFAFNDLKHMDSDKHKEKTGVPNELILANIAALAQSDWREDWS